MSETNTSGWNGQKILDSRHYDYTIKVKEWTAIEKALEGGIEWSSEALERFDCESNGSFELREKRPVNALSIRTPLQSMQNLARGSKDQARIVGASDRVSKIIEEDWDNNGNSWWNWIIDKPLLNVPAYGEYWVFASSPANISPIMKSQEKDNNPFVFGRTPLQVINYRYENGDTRTQGQFNDVLLLTSEVIVNTDTQYEENVNIAVRLTREMTYILSVDNCTAYNQDGNMQGYSKGDVIRMYPNHSGIVTGRRINIGGSIVKDLVNMSAQAMNVQSGSWISTFDSNYNQKWVAGEKLPDEFSSGVDSVIQFNDATTTYNVTDAAKGTIDNSTAFIDDLQQRADILMQNQYQNLAKKGGNAPSGEALTEMNSSQAQAVGYQMDMIGDAIEDIVAWLHILGGEKVPDDLEVIMPSTYESTSQADNMTLALDAQEITAHSEEALKVKLYAKWGPITPPSDLEAVVEAELKIAKELMKADNILTSASADDLQPEESGRAGDGKNQAGAEGDLDED